MGFIRHKNPRVTMARAIGLRLDVFVTRKANASGAGKHAYPSCCGSAAAVAVSASEAGAAGIGVVGAGAGTAPLPLLAPACLTAPAFCMCSGRSLR